MDNRFEGKVCPACQTPFNENDVIVVCGACKTPQHLACWQAHNGCSTPGCTGGIEEVVLPSAPGAVMTRQAPEAEQPAVEQPMAQQPAIEQFMPEQPMAQQPMPEQPAATAEPEKKPQKKSKAPLIIVLALVLLAALAAAAYFFLLPMLKYNNAAKALDSRDFDSAYTMFTELNGYRDSDEKANDALFGKAQMLLENGQCDEAIELFERVAEHAGSEEGINEANYLKAGAMLENGEYDEAIETYTALGKYKDSADKVTEATYRKANAMLASGDYDMAVTLFQRLGRYSDSESKLKEAKYLKAGKCEEGKKYKEAYELYSSLGNYKDSQQATKRMIMLWEAVALNASNVSEAATFARVVSPTSDQYDSIYSTIIVFLQLHSDSYFWIDNDNEETTPTKNVKTILNVLPDSFKITSTLKDLMDNLRYGDLFSLHEETMRQCWGLFPFTRELAARDNYITDFLWGNWKGSGYYLKFYEDESDGQTFCSYDLPRVAKPNETEYFDIIDQTYCWCDKDSNVLADVFYFEILDYDKINVYCYKDGYTYTMRR